MLVPSSADVLPRSASHLHCRLKERLDKSEVQWREKASFAHVSRRGYLATKHTARVNPPFRHHTDTSCTGNNGYLRAAVRPPYILQHLPLNDRQRTVLMNVQPSATKLLQWGTYQRGVQFEPRQRYLLSWPQFILVFPPRDEWNDAKYVSSTSIPDPLQTNTCNTKRMLGLSYHQNYTDAQNDYKFCHYDNSVCCAHILKC